MIVPRLGGHAIDRIHLGTLQPWIDRRKKEGKAIGTINHGIKVVRRILNLAAHDWVGGYRKTPANVMAERCSTAKHLKTLVSPVGFEPTTL